MRLDEGALRAGYRLNAFEALQSTSDEALRRAVLGDRGNLWIVAAAQTGGRGRQGRVWASPPGNLYASLLLVDAGPEKLASQLSFVAAVAVAAALRPFLPPERPPALKWPNDVLVGGAKITGILVEGSRTRPGRFASVVGIGVNRVSHPEGMPYPVTDLFAQTTARPSLDDLFAALSGAVQRSLTLWDAGRGFAAIREAWLASALPAGTPLATTVAGRPLAGTFETIDDRGRLVLACEQGHLTIEAGDVTMAASPVRVSQGTG